MSQWALCGGAAALMLSGCGAPKLPGAGPREVRLAEFADESRPSRHPDTSTPQHHAGAAAVDDGTGVPHEGVAPVAAAPALGAGGGPALQPGQRVIVDSLVGQVNGAPVYAEQVFAPIDDQLRAVRQRTTDRDFEFQAAFIIMEVLRGIVLDNMFLAQARAELTPEERTGLFGLMRYIREYEIARGGGTRSGAEQRLRTREGMGLDERVQAHRDEMLIGRLFEQRINSRVIVSWRDVEREYQRRIDEFNPPATLKVSRVSVSADDAAKREQVERRLEAGEPFDAIAESLNQGGVWQTFELGPEGVAGLEVAPVLKERLDGLGTGETSEPFQVGSSTWWLHVVAIEQSRGRSLYDLDVQQRLMRELYVRRHDEERDRYVLKLIDESIKRELDAMLERLVRIAIHRYGR